MFELSISMVQAILLLVFNLGWALVGYSAISYMLTLTRIKLIFADKLSDSNLTIQQTKSVLNEFLSDFVHKQDINAEERIWKRK